MRGGRPPRQRPQQLSLHRRREPAYIRRRLPVAPRPRPAGDSWTTIPDSQPLRLPGELLLRPRTRRHPRWTSSDGSTTGRRRHRPRSRGPRQDHHRCRPIAAGPYHRLALRVGWARISSTTAGSRALRQGRWQSSPHHDRPQPLAAGQSAYYKVVTWLDGPSCNDDSKHKSMKCTLKFEGVPAP